MKSVCFEVFKAEIEVFQVVTPCRVHVEGTGPKLTLKWLVFILTLLLLFWLATFLATCNMTHTHPSYNYCTFNLKSTSSALKMETRHSSQRVASAYKTTWCKNPKDYNVNWNMCLSATVMHLHNKIYLWNMQNNNGNQWMSPGNNSFTMIVPCVTRFTPSKILNILRTIFHSFWPEFLNRMAFHLYT